MLFMHHETLNDVQNRVNGTNGKTQFEEIQNSDGVLFPFVTCN